MPFPNRYPISGHTAIDDAADRLKPFTYRYKDPANEPNSHPNGSFYAGVMAQNLQTHPLTNQIVEPTPKGLTLQGPPLMSLLAATAGRAHDRLNAHENSISELHGLLAAQGEHHRRALTTLQQHQHMLNRIHGILHQKFGGPMPPRVV